MAQIHHATARKFVALTAEFSVEATLTVNEITGNYEITWDGDTYEFENAPEAVELFRAHLNDEDPDGFESARVEIDEEEEDDSERPSSMVPPKYKAIYAQFHDTCGDDLAKVLQDACYAGDTWNEENFMLVCGQYGIDGTKWRGNNGQRKMCLSNILRARLRKGMDVQILGTVLRGQPTE